MTSAEGRRRLAGFLVPVAIAVVAAVGGAVLLWTVRDQLPERIATHWGQAGTPDGFSTLAGVLVPGVAVPIAMTLLLAGLGYAIRHEATMAGLSSGTAIFMASLFFGSAFAQRGLTDASGFRLTNWMLAGSLAAGIGVGVVVGLCLRHRIPPAPTSEIPADARNLSWTGRLRPSTAGTIVLVCAIALTLAVGIWMWMTSGLWFVALIGALLIPLLPLLSATVSVNADGLRVSASGVTLMRVPRERFKEAHVTTVTPLGEYGGWGPRAGFDGSWGWVTTAGEALRVSRHDMSDLVFTVDDATAAATTINALAVSTDGTPV